MAAMEELVVPHVITNEEYLAIPDNTRTKLVTYIKEIREESTIATALLNSTKFNYEKKVGELESSLAQVREEHNGDKRDLENTKRELEELQVAAEYGQTQLTKLQQSVDRLEAETSQFRQQRDTAVSERDGYLSMVERRNAEAERLQEDVRMLSTQLRAAVTAKCSALVKADEAESRHHELDLKEKRLEQERELLAGRIRGLTEDLDRHAAQVAALRREHTARLVTLETQLTQKTEELRIALETSEHLTSSNESLVAKMETLADELRTQRDNEAKMHESYRHELNAQKKLAELYKAMTDDAGAKTGELETAVTELQKLLQSASQEHATLEDKLAAAELAHAETLAAKNECIALQKEELARANHLLEVARQASLQQTLEDLSPAAASASRLIKSGMTLTQIYSQYVTVCEELSAKTEEAEHLDGLLKSVVAEIEEKTPLLNKQREEFLESLDTIRSLTDRVDSFVVDNNVLREEASAAGKRVEHLTRENKRYRTELGDLAKQVCHLLAEVQAMHGGGPPRRSPAGHYAGAGDSSPSGVIISQKLVTFADIEEMQAKNQNLLAVVRELSARQEEMERANAEMNPEEVMAKLQQYEQDARELREQQEQHVRMTGEVLRQRDMYEDLYKRLRDATSQQDSDGDTSALYTSAMETSVGEPTPTKSPMRKTAPAAFDKTLTDDAEKTIKELEAKLEAAAKEAKETREEHDSYRVERQTNERQLEEQMEKMRDELRELRTNHGKLLMQAEYAEAKFKTAQANADTYKKQAAALDERNRCYNVTIAKHEQALAYLKDEALAAQAAASRAEVALEYLRQEHRALAEREARMVAEREAARREGVGQAVLMSNLDAIKASLERVEVEGRLRAESRLDEATQECHALRRRLQEEQDRFRELRDNLERRMEHAAKSLTEEQELAKRAREEAVETRAELGARNARVEELERRVKELLVVPVPSNENKTSAEIMERRLKDLERDYSLAQNKLKLAQQQLTVAQQNAKQYCAISDASEKQLTDLNAAYNAHKQAAEKTTAELNASLNEKSAVIARNQEELTALRNQLATAASVVTVDTNAEAKIEEMKAQLRDMEVAVAKERESFTTLSEGLRAAEEKYSRELVLHSVDIQELSALKETLSALRSEVSEALGARERAVEALTVGEASIAEKERVVTEKLAEGSKQIEELAAQNTLLHNQIEELSTQLAMIQAAGSVLDSSSRSLNVSVSDDETRSSDELLQIIRYLRKEKDIAMSKFDVLRLENMRLTSQQEYNVKQLEEARKALDAERAQSEVSTVTDAKHNELLRKLDTLNAVMDSNRSLRSECERLQARVTELSTEALRLAAELTPLKEHGGEVQAKLDAAEAENAALRGEAGRLRQRNNFLIERSNKASPEDWRKLQQERENLIRQLGVEKEAHGKLQEEARGVRQEKAKLEETLASSQRQHVDEVKRMREEMAATQQRVSAVERELNETRELCKKRNEELIKIKESLVANEAMLAEIRVKEIQVRKIAKKYKTSYEELLKAAEETKVREATREQEHREALEAAGAASRIIPPEVLEELREEGRKEVTLRWDEATLRHTDVVRELTEQVSSSNEASENLRKELDALKEASSKNVLIAAKQKIMKVSAENAAYREQVAELQARVTAIEQNRDESVVRTNALKSQYEARIARAEKETADARSERQQEKERLENEIKSLGQRVNQLQRNLYNTQAQQGKPSTSSGPGEKPASEPPTANIKPMAGPTSTAAKPTKQPQPSQQTATLTPWTGRGETPFASIRPMSMPSRTVTVLPTSQSTSHAIQSTSREPPTPVMVAPQQQLVHTTGTVSGIAVPMAQPAHPPTAPAPDVLSSTAPTSSHTDYMPATSSAGVSQMRQVIVQPSVQSSAAADEAAVGGSGNVTCQMEEAHLAAESTQDNEAQELPSCLMEDEPLQSDSDRQPQPVSTASSSPQAAVALVQPRVEQPPAVQQAAAEQAVASSQAAAATEQVASSRPAATEQAAASSHASGSNTVTTSQAAPAGTKRLREMEGDSSTGHIMEEDTSESPQSKRVRMVTVGKVTSGGLAANAPDSAPDVEYQVPTSSQRDQEDEIIIVDSADESEEEEEEEEAGEDDEGLDLDTEPFSDEVHSGEVYEVDAGYDERDDERDDEMMGYEEDEGRAQDEDDNEVEVLDDDSGDEVPNQSESAHDTSVECIEPSPEATSSVAANLLSSTDGGSNVCTSQTPFATSPHVFGRGRTVPPLNRQQQTLMLTPQTYDDQGDDSIVPSTPTLFVPRRTDGFSEAVSSPQVPQQQQVRFTFVDASPAQVARSGLAQVAIEGMDDTRIDLSQMEESGTGRSVPTTPLLPQTCVFSGAGLDQGAEVGQSEAAPRLDVEFSPVPHITITVADDQEADVEDMPPPEQLDVRDDSNGANSLLNQSTDSDVIELLFNPEGLISESMSSEGSSKPSVEVDEGREAVASVSTPPPAANRAVRGGMARRSGGRPSNRTRGSTRGTAQRTPIVWDEPASSQAAPMPSPQPVQRNVGIPMRVTMQPQGPPLLQQGEMPPLPMRGGMYQPQRGQPRMRRMRGGRMPKGFNHPYNPNRF